MRTGSQNPSKTHFLDGCSPMAFIISPTFTRQLYSGKGRVGILKVIAGSKRLELEAGKNLKASWLSLLKDFSA